MAVPVPKGYSTKYLVADALGTHDGVVNVLALDYWLAAAEAWIDKRTNRVWGVSTVTAEQHTFRWNGEAIWPAGYTLNPLQWVPSRGPVDPLVFLRTYPVSAVSAVRARYLSLGATTYLLATSDYELIDAPRGHLLVATNWLGQRLSIDYTVSVPVPADITLAATLLVTAWVQPMLSETPAQALSGIKSYAIGQDLSVTFQDAAGRAKEPEIPAKVLGLVDQYQVLEYVT